jgi:UPF0716 protein FxsA
MNPLLLFLLLPIAEIAVFAQVGDWIGALPTVGLVILSGIAGSLLLRQQGLSALRRAQEAATRGESPAGAVFEGFCIMVAGVLLIIPGFLTDIVGILLFVRPVRNALGRRLFERMMRSNGTVRVWSTGPGTPGAGHGSSGDRSPGNRPPPGVIDGEFREVDADAPRLEESRWDQHGPASGPSGERDRP